MALIKDYDAPIVSGGSFTWREFAKMKGFGTLGVPTKQEYDNAVFLFTQLQPLREKLGKPLIITSGVRTRDYTLHLRRRGIPAALHGAHTKWQAVDLTCPSMSNAELWAFCDKHWSGRMELLKYTPTWVHLDTWNWGKRQRFKP